MKTNAAICCMALLVLAMSGANVAAESFGFEEPDQGDGGWAYHADLTGWSWTPVGAGSGLSGPDGPWRCDSTSPDPLGDQFAFLQQVASISRTVTGLTAGALYEVTFYEASRSATAPGIDLTVIIDEGLSSEATIYSNGNVSNATWELRTATAFVAENTSITLTFSATNPLTGDRTAIIDGVSIDEIPPPPAAITPSSPFAVADESLSLTATAGGSGYQWSDEIGDISDGGSISGATTRVLTIDPLAEGDAGTYTITYEDGATKTVVSASYVLFVYPSGTTLPLTGLLGLGLLASACTMGGASVLRRKK